MVLLVIGVSRSSRPYVFLGIGLLLFLPEDMLVGYGILREGGLFTRYAHLVFVVSQLCILNGALRAGYRRQKEPDAKHAQPPTGSYRIFRTVSRHAAWASWAAIAPGPGSNRCSFRGSALISSSPR